jgi:hypothetical protein
VFALIDARPGTLDAADGLSLRMTGAPVGAVLVLRHSATGRDVLRLPASPVSSGPVTVTESVANPDAGPFDLSLEVEAGQLCRLGSARLKIDIGLPLAAGVRVSGSYDVTLLPSRCQDAGPIRIVIDSVEVPV